MEWDLRSILTGEFMGTDISRRFLLILAPALLMLIAIPLIRKKIPKNAFYGFRTPKTMAGSDEQWYRINREGGIAIFIAGSISLLASIFLRIIQIPKRKAFHSRDCIRVAATILTQLTGSAIAVQQLLRHQDLNVTTKNYARPSALLPVCCASDSEASRRRRDQQCSRWSVHSPHMTLPAS